MLIFFYQQDEHDDRTKTMKIMVERKFETENDAFWARHKAVANGWKVSLIAYDSDRDLYVFDVYYPN